VRCTTGLRPPERLRSPAMHGSNRDAALENGRSDARTPTVRAGTRSLAVVIPLVVVMTGCGSNPAVTSTETTHAPFGWPSKAEASSCATSSPDQWMHCLEAAVPGFARIPVSYLALPGSENAGTYNLDPFSTVNETGSACTTFSPGLSVNGVKAQRFSATQDQNIVQQLDGGVRWIDLQVAYNGDGNALGGWRVTQNLYSSWPLLEYLDQVANWAALHPNEVVFVDLATICYDHHPTDTIDKGLWANFATKSSHGAGPLTLADVASRAPATMPSLATATLSELSHAGHNVVVLVPADAKDRKTLERTYHVDPFLTRSHAVGHGSTRVVRSDPRVAPTTPANFTSANSDLAKIPTSEKPNIGGSRGSGIYVDKLTYELKGAPTLVQQQVLTNFVGLVTSQGIFRAWMSGLWSGQYPLILSAWGDATNVVIADGVEHAGFIPSVIAQNSR
jgi:hypothetical protein